MYGWYQYLAVVDHCRHRSTAIWHQETRLHRFDLGASIKGFKKAMGDDEPKQDKTSQDADFTAKSITDKQGEVKKEDAKSQDKEQV